MAPRGSPFLALAVLACVACNILYAAGQQCNPTGRYRASSCSASYLTVNNRFYSPFEYITGGSAAVKVVTSTENITVAGGSQELANLYSSQCSAPEIDVHIPLMNGWYQVTLFLADIKTSSTWCHTRFSATAEAEQQLTRYCVSAYTSAFTASNVSFITQIEDNALDFNLTADSVPDGEVQIAGFLVEELDCAASSSPGSTTSVIDSPSPSLSPSPSPSPSPAASPSPSPTASPSPSPAASPSPSPAASPSPSPAASPSPAPSPAVSPPLLSPSPSPSPPVASEPLPSTSSKLEAGSASATTTTASCALPGQPTGEVIAMTCGNDDLTINGVHFVPRKYVSTYSVPSTVGDNITDAGDLLPVYQSECLATVLNLTIPAAMGFQKVILMFAELTLKDASFKDPQRVFSIEMEGATMNPKFSISDTVPFQTATNLTYTIKLEDTNLDIALLSRSINPATLSGVIIERLACDNPRAIQETVAPVAEASSPAVSSPLPEAVSPSPQVDMSRFSSGMGAAMAQMVSQQAAGVQEAVTPLGISSSGSCIPPVYVCPTNYSPNDQQLAKPSNSSADNGQCMKFNEPASFYVTSSVPGDCSSGMVFRVLVSAQQTTTAATSQATTTTATQAASTESSIVVLGVQALTTGKNDSNVVYQAMPATDMQVVFRDSAPSGNRKLLDSTLVKTYMVDPWQAGLCYPQVNAVVGDQLCVKWMGAATPHDVRLIQYEVEGTAAVSSATASSSLMPASSPVPATSGTVLAGFSGVEAGAGAADVMRSAAEAPAAVTAGIALDVKTSASATAVTLLGAPALCLMDLAFLQRPEADVTFIQNALVAKSGKDTLTVAGQDYQHNQVWAELQKDPAAISGTEALLQSVLVGKMNQLYGAAMSEYYRKALQEGEANLQRRANGADALAMAAAIKSYAVSAAGCVKVGL